MSADDDAPAPVRMDIVRGAPTDEELAAVIAVLSDAYVTEVASAEAEEPRARDGWTLSQRSLRTPLRRDLGWGRIG